MNIKIVRAKNLETHLIFNHLSSPFQIEALCQMIERQWYSDRAGVEAALARASSHDLGAVFKRLLRALPQPPLTQELMRLFYHTYGECQVFT